MYNLFNKINSQQYSTFYLQKQLILIKCRDFLFVNDKSILRTSNQNNNLFNLTSFIIIHKTIQHHIFYKYILYIMKFYKYILYIMN
ncbi:hypothetical protein pb186bvf_011392 [Paramecium bursaria]